MGFYKEYEHITQSLVMKHLSQYGVLTDYQLGFRAKRSTETQLICTIHDIARAIQSNETIHAEILDFSKAYWPLLFLMYINDLPDGRNSTHG